jgi:hypothetical protein
MKRLGVLILIVLVTGFTGYQKDDKKAIKAKERLEMAQLIESGKFRFVARSANSILGSFDHLSYNYDMVFDSLRITANLPYYGRAYHATYGDEGGVKFELKATQIDKNWNERKKLFTLSTKVSDSKDDYTINLTTGLDGFADLRINFRDRTWMSYYGTIQKIETKTQ